MTPIMMKELVVMGREMYQKLKLQMKGMVITLGFNLTGCGVS